MSEPTPQLSPEQRRHLEELLRAQIASIRAICKLLNRPSPIISREDQRHERTAHLAQH